jgi:hypothetical protein
MAGQSVHCLQQTICIGNEFISRASQLASLMFVQGTGCSKGTWRFLKLCRADNLILSCNLLLQNQLALNAILFQRVFHYDFISFWTALLKYCPSLFTHCFNLASQVSQFSSSPVVIAVICFRIAILRSLDFSSCPFSLWGTLKIT